jgi:hypothetical protein
MAPAPRRPGQGILPEDTKICVVMVGLPARGKSYIAQKGKQLILWLDEGGGTCQGHVMSCLCCDAVMCLVKVPS